MRLFDSHAHIISGDFSRYPVSPLSGTLDRKLDDPMTAERLLREMDTNSVEKAVIVQRAHVYGYNNSYVVDSAKQYADRLTAVCCIDPEADDGADKVRYWIGERGATGIRLTEPYKNSGTGWVESAQAQAVWYAATELGASVCLHLYRWNRDQCLPAVLSMIKQFPSTTVVIDHLSNNIAEQGAPDWGIDAALTALADCPNVALKLSTLNYGWFAKCNIDPTPVIAKVIATFGADRLMWGSDVAQSAGTYAELIAQATQSIAGFADTEQRQVLYDTTDRIYGAAFES